MIFPMSYFRYEGTGRSLSLKLINELRTQTAPLIGGKVESNGGAAMTGGRVLHEVTLSESIRYATGDHVEKWLNDVLCLDATSSSDISSGCPLPENCELYYINR